MKAKTTYHTNTVERNRPRLTEEIRVAWCRQINGSYSAFAEENKAGYEKGACVAVIPSKLTNMPRSIHVLPKLPGHEI
jgi:hypothetical protein